MPYTTCTFFSEPRCLPCPWAPIFSSRKIRAQLAENLSPQWNWLTLGMSLPFSEPMLAICQKDVITCVHHSRGAQLLRKPKWLFASLGLHSLLPALFPFSFCPQAFSEHMPWVSWGCRWGAVQQRGL